ncbi:hypothetical protein BCR39DRAFT_548293 [Naematelia encephala]|uniref:Uncharacterized protein n=1 Tax=Naematelia encephala TaxID=71784 RepID=A0A1Y2AMZ8_9TREE|nr:hypothetical protein BCR39DRAFT_548293 [Naematelia encephala]
MVLTSTPRPVVLSFRTLLIIPSLVLGTAYLWTVLHRPIIPRQLKLDDPSTFGWPSWYGKGIIPYDVPYSRDGQVCQDKSKVLYFIDLPYDSPYIPSALSTLSALEAAPDIDVVAISPSSSTWDQSLSVTDNMEMLGCGDRLWRVSDRVASDVTCSNSTVITEIYGSTQSDTRADVTILSQPHEMVSNRLSHASLKDIHGDEWKMGLFAHILPSADPTIFYPRNHTPDPNRVTYFPRPDTPPDRYPKLPRGSSWTIYRSSLSSPPKMISGQNHLAPDSAYRRYWQKEAGKRAAAMRSASVCVFEQWREGLLDDDMAQAMMAGCVVATVIPEVERELLSTVVVPLPKSDPDSWIENLENALSVSITGQELQRRALHAFIIARQKFTTEIRIKAVRDVVKKWQVGARGYLFPNGWRWSCDSPGEKPPWCVG